MHWLVLLSVLLLASFASYGLRAVYAESWDIKAPFPAPRSGLFGDVINGKLYVVGGGSNRLDVYDPATDTWDTSRAAGPVGFGGVAAAALNGKLYVVGGGPSPTLKRLDVYDPATNTWDTTRAAMPTARSYLAAAAIAGKLYVVGGYDGNNVVKTLEVYDPATNQWAAKTAMPTARDFIAAAGLNGKLYVVGGTNTTITLNTMEVYDPATNTWDTTKPGMPTARLNLVAMVMDGKLHALGGNLNLTSQNKLEVYDPATNQWTTKLPMLTARDSFAAGVINGKIYAVGGVSSGYLTGAVEVYDPFGIPAEIIVSEPGVGNIADGGSFNFGTTPIGTPITKTFRVANSGGATLSLSNLTVSTGFAITSNFGSTSIAPNSSTTFQITMAAGSVGTPSSTLSFTNNDTDENPFNFTIGGTVVPAGSLQFSSSQYTTNENVGIFNVTVNRVSGAGGTVTANYATSNGTAMAGSDYTAANGTLVFPEGQTSTTFAVPITWDTVNEGTETVNLTISNPTGGATLGTPTTAVLRINNIARTCPTSFTVNDLGDAEDASLGDNICATAGGACTLRAATREANASTVCSPLTINFSVTGTITLQGGDIFLVHPDLTIQGPGANLLTISGNQASRVFFTNSNATATIKDLTIANGRDSNAGGGINNLGNVTIAGCVLRDNTIVTSGGSFNEGAGGGIYNIYGTVTILNSTLSGNSASANGGSNSNSGRGGGIYNNNGTVKITNSSISGNSASANGSGNNYGEGGGIYNSNGGALTITNSTISGNTASASGGNNDNGRGGGIFNGAAVLPRNMLLAGNSVSGTTAQGPDAFGSFATQGHNLIGQSDDSIGFTQGSNGDLVGTIAAPLNAQLGPLANNGGLTQTHALLPGSPAINTGDNCVLTNTCSAINLGFNLTTDQRGAGFPRNAGSQVDIGAFESQDMTPPDTTITGNPPAPSNSASATFSFTGSDNLTLVASLTYECSLDGGAFTACTSPRTFPGLSDGSHNFQVRARDGSGNADPTPASFTWLIDTTAPDTTITATPTNPSGSANASFSFTGNDGGGAGVASFQCQLDGGGFSACTSPQLYTALSQGNHTFQVRAIDVLGNADSTPGSFTWAIDTTAPDTTITANPANPSASANASFSFTGSDSGGSGVAGFECKLDGGAFIACTSPQTYAGMSDGSHTFQVRAIDAAGNVDGTPASFTWVVDATAPDTTITANPTNPANAANASFSFTGNDGSGTGVASFQCKLNGGSFVACTNPQTYTGLSEGSHTFQVRAVDTAGNVDNTPASFTWVIDTVAPDTTITANPANPSGSANASFSFTGNDGGGTGVANFQCKLDGGSFGTCTSPQTYAGLSDGSHTFQVRAVDAAGNTDSTPAGFTWVVDAVPPDTTITANPPNPAASANASFSFTGSDPGGSGVAGFECKLDGGVFSACASPKTYTGLSDGSHTFLVRAIDAAGNADSTPANFTWLVDTVAPETTITANPPGLSNSRSAGFSFTGSDGGGSGVTGFECQLDGGGFSACSGPRQLSGLGDGGHTFQVRARDVAGNADSTPASYTWTVEATPPDTTITGNPPNPSSSTSASFIFTGSDNATPPGSLTFECKLDGGSFAICASPQSYSGLSLNTHTFQVRAIDTAGNVDPTPAGYTWAINAPPVITPANLSRAAGSTALTTTIANANDSEDAEDLLVVKISTDGTNFFDSVTTGNVTVALADQNAGAAGVNPSAVGDVIVTITTLCDATAGPLNLFLRVTDSGGQMDTKPWTLTILPNPSPVLGYNPANVIAGTTPAINPATGPSDNGTINPLLLQSLSPNNGGLAVSLNAATGTLTVLSAALSGNYTVTILATDNCGAATLATLPITVVCPAITLAPASLPDASINTAYPATLAASPTGGNYTFAVTSGLLPAGLTLNTNGSFSGAPTQSGTFNFRVAATGFGSCSSFRDYVLNVSCPAMSLAPANFPGGTVGTAYNQAVSATPAGSYSYSVTSGALPTGLALNAATGAITGTPTAGGTFNFRIAATSGSCSAARDYTVTIACASLTITTTTLPAGTVGSDYSQTIGVTPAAPAGSYNFTLLTGSLPSGLTLNTTTGSLTGLPTVTGSYGFTIKAMAATGCAAAQSYTLQIICPSITLSALPTPMLNTAYNQIVSAMPSGGSYSFAVTAGVLPAGLSLNPATGLVSGTPATAGAYNFTITATGFGACTGSRTHTGTIAGGGCPTITLPELQSGQPAQLYNQSVAATPTGTYSYAVSSGNLPPGLTLYGVAGLIFGHPTGAGIYNFTVKATGSNNCTGERAYTVIIGTSALRSNAAVANDFDGDGKSDLAVWRGTTSEWLIQRSSDDQLQTVKWGASYIPYRDVTVAADYDGDGKTDIAVFRRGNGHWYIRQSSDGKTLDIYWGMGSDVPVPADYDGDGKADIAVWRGSEGNWYIRRSSDDQVETIYWGKSSAPYNDIAAPGDYDGDGKTDVAVFRSGTGHWFIKRSSDGMVVDQYWGFGKDVPVPADYDGDGKTDIAVWRGADTHWYIVRSSDGETQIISWGTSSLGDVPAPGNFDGDGKADVAVWRASEQAWYIKCSRDGRVVNKSQGSQGDVPVALKSEP
jgi:N-acetylneuraminic acid mutarotase